MRYSEEERERILQEAHDLLAVIAAERELEHAPVRLRVDSFAPQSTAAQDEWNRSHDERKAAREAETARRHAREQEHIRRMQRAQSAGLSREDIEQGLGEVVSELRREWRQDIAKANSSSAKGETIDLPRLPTLMHKTKYDALVTPKPN
jgi:hypothetical protein